MTMRPRAAALTVTSVVLLLAACGPDSPDQIPVSGQARFQGGSETCPPEADLPEVVADHGAAPATGTELTIDAGDSFFSPTCVTDLGAGTVQIVVANTGSILHNVTIKDQGIDTDVDAGETITVSVDIGDGTVGYYCKYHRTSGMVGALVPTA